MDLILFMSFNKQGDHIIEPYSKIDRTSAMYKVFKNLIFLNSLQFRLQNPNVLDDLFLLQICLEKDKSLDYRKTPKFFTWFIIVRLHTLTTYWQ